MSPVPWRGSWQKRAQPKRSAGCALLHFNMHFITLTLKLLMGEPEKNDAALVVARQGGGGGVASAKGRSEIKAKAHLLGDIVGWRYG